MNRYIWLLFAILLLSAVKLPAAEWTVLVYMAADNGLNGYAIADINEMEAAEINPNINVVVQIDESEYSQTPGARRYKIRHDEQTDHISSQVVQELGEIDSGDYNSLIDFANWGFNRYPANHKILVLWSHGNSWYKGNDTKWICSDEDANNAIEVWNGDLQEAISSIPNVDVLLLDACSMQSIEVMNEVYRNCDYVIGSEDLVPASGFPYTEILNVIDDDMNPAILVGLIPRFYVTSYLPFQSQNPYEYVINASSSYAVSFKFPALREQIGIFVDKWKTQTELFIPLRNSLMQFNDTESDVDLHELLVKATNQASNAELATDAAALLATFNEAYPVQYNNTYEDIPAGYAAIWFPSTRYAFGGLWTHYGYLDFAETGWSGFLNNYNSPDDTPPLKPRITNAHQELNSLYIEWEPAPDPEVLVYDLWTRDAQGHSTLIVHHNPQTSVVIIVDQSLTVYLAAMDEAENISATDSLVFVYKEAAVQMYFTPTPVQDIQTAKLHIYVPIRLERLQWKIYDITGKNLYTRQINFPIEKRGVGKEVIVDLSRYQELKKLSSGIYFCTLTGYGVSLRTKLVIAK